MRYILRLVLATAVLQVSVSPLRVAHATDEAGTCHPTADSGCITQLAGGGSAAYEDSTCLPANDPACYSCEVAEGNFCIHFGKSLSGYRSAQQ